MSFECEKCFKIFSTSVMLRIHEKTEHNIGNNHKCEFCLCLFPSFEEYKKHALTHPGENPWVCLICTKKFSRASKFKRHQLFHKAEVLDEDESYDTTAKPPKYKIIQKSEADNYQVTLEIEEITPVQRLSEELRFTKKPNTCKACCVAFPAKYDLDKHLEMDKLKKFKCKSCGKLFGHDASLIRHEESHHKEGFHCCEVCQELLPTEEDLDEHVKTHQYSERCLRCSERFIVLDDMLTHQELHLGLIHYECEICKEKFSNYPHLEEHLETHTNTQRCKVCEQVLNGVEDLKQHIIQSHTILKPFYCKECCDTFTNKERLSSHYKTSHGRDFIRSNLPKKTLPEKQHGLPIIE